MKKILFLILTVTSLVSCKKETVTTTEHEGSATLTFDAKVGAEDFALNKSFTINNQSLSFSRLRYWVSNVKLINTDGSSYTVPNAYYLVEETSAQSVQDGSFTYPANKREDIALSNIPLGEYNAITFSIGVDEKYNDNLSLQAGELSQLNGMTNVSWMWHTTYIFSSLAGTMTTTGGEEAITVETGLNSNFKTVQLPLPAAIKISSGKTTGIALSVDVAAILNGVDLTASPTVGADEPEVMASVANNFASGVFTVNKAW